MMRRNWNGLMRTFFMNLFQILLNVKVFPFRRSHLLLLENILGEVEEEFVDNVKNKTSDILEHNKTGVEKLGEELKEIWQTAGEVGKELLEDVEEILGLGHKENHENKTENASL